VITSHAAFEWAREQADRREKGHGYAVAGAVAWCVVATVVAFVGHHRIPLLSLVDLGFHELGHLVSYPFGNDMFSAAMGSIAQVAVPLGIAVYFAWIRSDHVATSVCLTWAATAARDVSVYIKDAPYQQLELIGGEHDWAFLLAGKLDRAEPLGNRVTAFGVLLLLVAFALAVATPFLERWRHDRRHQQNLGAPIRFLD
jgi:hypothetical protein